jgi:hypothetical protein
LICCKFGPGLELACADIHNCGIGLALSEQNHIHFAHERLARLPCQNFSFWRFLKENAGELSLLAQLAGVAEDVINLPIFLWSEGIEWVVDFRLKGNAGWERENEKKDGEDANSRTR